MIHIVYMYVRYSWYAVFIVESTQTISSPLFQNKSIFLYRITEIIIYLPTVTVTPQNMRLYHHNYDLPRDLTGLHAKFDHDRSKTVTYML